MGVFTEKKAVKTLYTGPRQLAVRFLAELSCVLAVNSSSQAVMATRAPRLMRRFGAHCDAWAVQNAGARRACDAKQVGHWRRGRSARSAPPCRAAGPRALLLLFGGKELTNCSAGVRRRAGSLGALNSLRQPPMIRKIMGYGISRRKGDPGSRAPSPRRPSGNTS
jgi:hypothetical protein